MTQKEKKGFCFSVNYVPSAFRSSSVRHSGPGEGCTCVLDVQFNVTRGAFLMKILYEVLE